MVQLTNETIDACLMPERCRMCEEAELARAEIAAEAEMERRVERAFEERRW